MGDLIFWWVLLSLIPPIIANSRGRSPVGWFLFSLVISPLVAVVLLLVLADESVGADRHDELVQALGAAPVDDPLVVIERLAVLRDTGAITPTEYETKKAQLLERI